MAERATKVHRGIKSFSQIASNTKIIYIPDKIAHATIAIEYINPVNHNVSNMSQVLSKNYSIKV